MQRAGHSDKKRGTRGITAFNLMHSLELSHSLDLTFRINFFSVALATITTRTLPFRSLDLVSEVYTNLASHPDP